ncbi:MAG: hypothetical protein K5751_07850 [Treponemataceae bacterium]|nr:hypothetical protein [Treponemataceae bacterium]
MKNTENIGDFFVEPLTEEWYNYTQEFNIALKKYINKGIHPSNDLFVIGKTPIVLQETGNKLTEVTMPVSIVQKIIETHGLNYDEISDSLFNLYNPVLVFDFEKAASKNKSDSKLVLTDIFKDNNPIGIVLDINSEIQDIRSGHGINFIVNSGTDLIKKWANDGLCGYVDDRKIEAWCNRTGVNFPLDILHTENQTLLTKSSLLNHQKFKHNLQKDKELMSDLADILENGEVITRKNPTLDGDVRVKRGGLNEGLVHLIDHRIRERVTNKKIQMDEELAKKETSAVLFLAVDNIDKAPAVKEDSGHFAVYNKGIKTVIGKDKNGRYVITGYDNNQTKKEATESVNAVIAQYGDTPEFLGIYAQVGAVIASYNILPQSQEKSNNPLKYYMKIEVNGKERECKNGVLEGFKNAVRQLDSLIDTNHELCDENNRLVMENMRLKEQLNKKNHNTEHERG